MTDFSAYVFYVNRPDLLIRSIEAFPELLPKLTIVDNSAEGLYIQLSTDDCVDYVFKSEDLFQPPVPMTYAQSMNWMMKNALAREVDFIIHFHSDAFSTNPEAVNQLLAFVRSLKQTERKWACAWTYYDILWAVNPLAMEDIGGWDTNLPNYFGDNDFKYRCKLAGWECIDTHIEGINHEGSATINSDPELKYINGITFPLAEQYYRAKWGNRPGEEKFTKPFNWAWKPKFHALVK